MSHIWTPTKLGDLTLPHRLAMAPMTRSRAKPDGTPGELSAEYYGQRAGMGLLITEGTQPSEDGQGYLTTPGIYTDAHVAGWKKVSTAVHDRDGALFIQLMHVGRMSHPDNTPHGRQPVAPSAVAPGVDMFTGHGMRPIPEPRALAPDEVAGTVADFVLAARRAIEAGADGVELHGANGYLIHQFFAPNANLRSDLYGGPIENRIRFALEVAAAVADAIGPQRTGFRISPGVPAGGLVEGEEGPELYRRLIAELDRLGLAYLHILHAGNDELLTDIRRLWRHALLVNRPGRPRERIGSDITAGLADIETYGQMALANPDLAERIRRGAALNPAKREAYYGGGAAGYTDYPALPEALERLEQLEAAQ